MGLSSQSETPVGVWQFCQTPTGVLVTICSLMGLSISSLDCLFNLRARRSQLNLIDHAQGQNEVALMDCEPPFFAKVSEQTGDRDAGSANGCGQLVMG